MYNRYSHGVYTCSVMLAANAMPSVRIASRRVSVALARHAVAQVALCRHVRSLVSRVTRLHTATTTSTLQNVYMLPLIHQVLFERNDLLLEERTA